MSPLKDDQTRSPSPTRGFSADFAEFARTRDPDLRAELIGAHLGLAVQLARRFTGRAEPLDDLVQVACVGLINSVDRFDPERGVEFSSFATRTILGELKRHFRDHGWAVRAPRRVQELYLELRETTTLLTQELGRPPKVAELARAARASEEDVLEALEATYSYRVATIDRSDGLEEGAWISEEDTNFASVDNRSSMAPTLAHLSARDRRILRLRFVDDLTQSEIAERVGVNQMQVSRLLKANLAHLRQALTEADAEGGPDDQLEQRAEQASACIR